jgi:predicted nuclease with TOPRIM domain
MNDLKSNYPSQEAPKKDNRVLIYSLLIGALLVSWGYMFFSNKKAADTEQTLTSQNVAVTTELDEVKDMYNESLYRLDSLIGENETLSTSLNAGNAEIAKLRSEISKIVSNKNATEADLKKARAMISELNGKITGLAAEVERLQGENMALSSENNQIKEEKAKVESDLSETQSAKAEVEKDLAKTKDIASTMKASNITINALKEKSSGKEKEVSSAKKADKMRINFVLDDNRLAQPGEKEIYVVVYSPSGTPVTYNSSDAFIRRDGASQPYTAKVVVNYEGGTNQPVSFDWKNDKDFQEGVYKIEIYHNGFKIGEQKRTLKKGGLFS